VNGFEPLSEAYETPFPPGAPYFAGIEGFEPSR